MSERSDISITVGSVPLSTGRAKIRIMCPRGAIYLSVDCCFCSAEYASLR